MEEHNYELKICKGECDASVIACLWAVERNYKEDHNHLIEDYFVSYLKYKEERLRHRFRMYKQLLFLRIMNKIVEHDAFFNKKPVLPINVVYYHNSK